MTERTVVVYHADCPYGFGGAWAAWKRFGDVAEYRAIRHSDGTPQDLAGAKVYFVDFALPKDVLLAIEQQTASLCVLDHHVGAREAVEATREHVFDETRSAATIAWNYFHPGSPIPKLLLYAEDADLWHYLLPNSKEINAFISVAPFDFEEWDKLAANLEDARMFETLAERGACYQEYFTRAVEKIAKTGELMQFDEFTILAANSPRLFRSEVGHLLSQWQPPFGIAYYKIGHLWHCSMRGSDAIDLSEIAKRYGGNGHHNAASFYVREDEPFPFTPIDK